MEKMELRAVNGVTVTGPTRISSNAGTFCWTSGPFVTIAEGDKGLENAEYVSVKRSISCLALSPDKKRLVTGEAGKDPCVRVWCRESKKYAAKFSGHRFEIINVAWHPEGKHVLSCGDQHDRQVFIWCLKTNGKMATSRLQQEPSFSLFFSPKTFITVGKGLIRFWTFPSQRARVSVQMLTGRNAPLKQRRDHTFIDACATSTNVFAVAEEGIAKLSGTRSLQSWFDHSNSNGVSKCQCISTNGEHLFVGVNTNYGGCVLVLTTSFERLCEMAIGIDYPPIPVAIAPVRNNEVFVVYQDRSCTLWDSDLENARILEEYAGIRGPVNSLAAFEQNTVISGSTDGTCRVWELGSRDLFQVEIYATVDEKSIRVVALNESRDTLAVGLSNGNIELYRRVLSEATEQQTWNRCDNIEAHNGEVTSISWRKDMLATGGRDRFVHVIFINSGRTSLTVDYHTSAVTAVNWIVDEAENATLVSGGADKALFFLVPTDESLEREKWIKTPSSICDIKGRKRAYVAQGKQIASYDIRGELIKKYESEKWTKNLISVCLDDNEEYLAASCQANVVVFDVERASVLHVVPVHAISIALALTDTAPILIAGDSEGNISMWRTNPGSMIHRSHSLPLPSMAEASAREEMSASSRTPKRQNDFEDKKVRRRSKWSSMPTPFKIKAALDCSAVTVYDEEEEEAEEHDLELPELTLEGEEETVIATNNSVSPDADSNESLEAHFATCRSEFPDFPEIPTDECSRPSLSTNAIKRLSNQRSVTETIVEEDPAKNDSSGISSDSFNSPRKDKCSPGEEVRSMITQISRMSEADVKECQKELFDLLKVVSLKYFKSLE